VHVRLIYRFAVAVLSWLALLARSSALGEVGIILALEASRLARDNAAWYRLLGAPRGAVLFVRRWKGSAAGPSQRPDPGIAGEGGSSLGNVGTGRYCQTAPGPASKVRRRNVSDRR